MCSICRRPVCDLCLGQIDHIDYCPAHFAIEESRIRERAYALPPLPEPMTVTEMLLGVWAVVGAVSPWLAWYRTLVITQGPQAVTIDETGWEAGGIAALASLALLVTGLALGIMVGLRAIRARLVPREPVAHTAVAMGVTSLALIAFRVATRSANIYAGLYLAITSATLALILGRRLLPPRTRR